jgi:hypothetical protein
MPTGAALKEGKPMALAKFSTVLGAIALAAAGGMIGQSLAANAGALRVSTTDKVFYAKTNRAFAVSNTTAVGSAKTVLAVTVHAPSAGQAVVVINTSMWTDYPSSAGSTLFATQTFGRCGHPDSFDRAANCQNLTTYYFQKPPNTSSSDITEPYSLQAQLHFARSGNRTLYLNANSAGYVGGLQRCARRGGIHAEEPDLQPGGRDRRDDALTIAGQFMMS